MEYATICETFNSCPAELFYLKSTSLVVLSLILVGGGFLLFDFKKIARIFLTIGILIQLAIIFVSALPTYTLHNYHLEWLLLLRVVNLGSHIAALLGNSVLLMFAWNIRFPHDFFLYFTSGISILIVQLSSLILPEFTGSDSNWSTLPSDTLVIWALATLTALPILLLSRDLFFTRNVDVRRLWRPIVLFMVACVVACGFSLKLQFDEIRFLSRTEDLFINGFKVTVESRIERRASILKLLLEIPPESMSMDVEAAVREVAKGLVNSNQTSESVYWLDTQFKEKWRVSDLEPEPSLNLERIRAAVRNSELGRTRIIHLFDEASEDGLSVILPFLQDGKTVGYVVAYFRIQEILEKGYEALGDATFNLHVLANNEEILFSSNRGSVLPFPRRTGTFNIFERHLVYKISLRPNAFTNFITFLPKLILFLGIIAAIHIGHLLYVYSNLQTSFDEVENRVAERTKELQDAKLKAEDASRTKSQFLANISHEIRTPLNVLTGASELLAETSLDPQQKHYVNMFRQASDNLLRLVNDIIDLSKVESGQVELQAKAFSLKSVAEELVTLYRVKAAEKGIQLLAHMDSVKSEFFVGDSLRIKQIIGNILSNAIKFTDHGGVTLTVTSDGTEIKFRISDTGIGIASDKLEKVFERFIQMDSSLTRNKGGAGLGLTIAKNLVELMGGNIKVFSQPGHGTTFLISMQLPVSEKIYSDRKTKLVTEALPPGLKILITDDSIENRELLKIFLSKHEVQVDEADNGFVALEKLNANSYDLVIMDMQMPVLDGYSAVTRWRQFEQERDAPELPILALTAHALGDDSRRCIDAGCTDYLSKPVTKAQLTNKVLELISNSPITTPRDDKLLGAKLYTFNQKEMR